ncbi:MAG: hypothetical protein ACRDS9_11460 [Pseudonocardiaceae bacterium]
MSELDDRPRRDLECFRNEAADTSNTRDEAQRSLTDAERAVNDAATALQELRDVQVGGMGGPRLAHIA